MSTVKFNKSQGWRSLMSFTFFPRVVWIISMVTVIIKVQCDAWAKCNLWVEFLTVRPRGKTAPFCRIVPVFKAESFHGNSWTCEYLRSCRNIYSTINCVTLSNMAVRIKFRPFSHLMLKLIQVNNEWVASNRILVFVQRFSGSPRGKHCASCWKEISDDEMLFVLTSKKTIVERDQRFFAVVLSWMD